MKLRIGDVVTIAFGHTVFIKLRHYKDGHWGYRRLGYARFAFDFGRLSIIIEKY